MYKKYFKCTTKRKEVSEVSPKHSNDILINTILDRQHLHVQFVGFYLIIIFYISQMGLQTVLVLQYTVYSHCNTVVNLKQMGW